LRWIIAPWALVTLKLGTAWPDWRVGMAWSFRVVQSPFYHGVYHCHG
jgi:hypothetical protein